MMNRAIFFVLIPFFFSEVFSTTLYADPASIKDDSCVLVDPCSFHGALGESLDDDTIILLPGVYEDIGTVYLGKRLTISGQMSGISIFSGSVTFLLESDITMENIKFSQLTTNATFYDMDAIKLILNNVQVEDSDGIKSFLEFNVSGNSLEVLGSSISTIGETVFSLEDSVGLNVENSNFSDCGRIFSLSNFQNDITLTSIVSTDIGNNELLGGFMYLSTSLVSTITLTSSEFERSKGKKGGVLYVLGHTDTSPTITVTDSNFRSNEGVEGNGGVFYFQNTGATSITKSNFYNNKAAHDGGVAYCNNVDLSVSECIANSNEAGDDGGVFYSYLNKLTIEESDFSSNKADGNRGGVISSSKMTEIVVSHSDFDDNFCHSDGGVVFVTDVDSSVFENCTFTNNVGGDDAGVIFVNGGDVLFRRCTMSDNKALFDDGGVMWIGKYSTATFDGCALTNNSAKSSGGTVYARHADWIKFRFSEISGSVADGGSGGAIAMKNSTFDLYSTDIVDCYAKTSGGGVFVDELSGSVVMFDSKITDNVAEEGVGGGVSLKYWIDSLVDINITDCAIENNVASMCGGISIEGGDVEGNAKEDDILHIFNTPFRKNKHMHSTEQPETGDFTNNGAGLKVVNMGTIKIEGCTFEENVMDGSFISSWNHQLQDWNEELSTLFCDYPEQKFTPAFCLDHPDSYRCADYDYDTASELVVKDSGRKGGALFVHDAKLLEVKDCIFNENFAVGAGGAIFAMADEVVVLGTDFDGNEANSGGGIFVFLGSLRIENSNLKNHFGKAGGGAISLLEGGPLIVRDTELDDNSAEALGGGVSVIFSCQRMLGMVEFSDTNFRRSKCITDEGECDGGAIYMHFVSIFDYTRGVIEDASSTYGGGLYFLQSVTYSHKAYDGNLYFEEVTIRDCHSLLDGGGVYGISFGDFVADFFVVEDCSSQSRGGGVYLEDFYDIEFSDSGFYRNRATIFCGAGYMEWALNVHFYDFNVVNNTCHDPVDSGGTLGGLYTFDSFVVEWVGGTLAGNEADLYGGGFHVFDVYEEKFLMEDVLVKDNKAGTDGGGVYVYTLYNGAVGEIRNCKFVGNEAEEFGGALMVSFGDDVLIEDCEFYDNKATTGSSMYVSTGGVRLKDLYLTGDEGDSALYVVSQNIFEFENIEVDNVEGNVLLLDITSDNPVIDNLVITNSMAKSGVLNIDTFKNPLIVKNSRFENNHGNLGGAVYDVKMNEITYDNCVFRNNHAQKGGAMYITGPHYSKSLYDPLTQHVSSIEYFEFLDMVGVKIQNCVFEGNQADKFGGSLYIYSSLNWVAITNSTFSKGNSEFGSEIYLLSSLFTAIGDTNFTDSVATEKGTVYAIHSYPALGGVTFRNNTGTCLFEEYSVIHIGGCIFQDCFGGGAEIVNADKLVKFTMSDFQSCYSVRGGGLNLYDVEPAIMGEVVELEPPTLQNAGSQDFYNRTKHKLKSKNGTLDVKFKFSELTFKDCKADEYGGGMYVYNSDKIVLSGVSFIRNEANLGGGLALEQCSTCEFSFERSISFLNNTAKGGGGIFDLRNSVGDLAKHDTVFSGNDAQYGERMGTPPKSFQYLFWSTGTQQQFQSGPVEVFPGQSFDINVRVINSDGQVITEYPDFFITIELNQTKTHGNSILLGTEFRKLLLLPNANRRTSTSFQGLSILLSPGDYQSDDNLFIRVTNKENLLGPGFVKDGFVPIRAQKCPPGYIIDHVEHSNGRTYLECLPCPEGQYSIINGSHECNECPEHATCELNVVEAEDNYWAFYDYGTNEVHVDYCENGNCEGSNTCKGKYDPEQPLCAACLDGYSEWNGECIECDGTNVYIMFVYVLFIFFLGSVTHINSQQPESGIEKLYSFFGQTYRYSMRNVDTSFLKPFTDLIFGFKLQFGWLLGDLLTCPFERSSYTKMMFNIFEPLFIISFILLLLVLVTIVICCCTVDYQILCLGWKIRSFWKQKQKDDGEEEDEDGENDDDDEEENDSDSDDSYGSNGEDDFGRSLKDSIVEADSMFHELPSGGDDDQMNEGGQPIDSDDNNDADDGRPKPVHPGVQRVRDSIAPGSHHRQSSRDQPKDISLNKLGDDNENGDLDDENDGEGGDSDSDSDSDDERARKGKNEEIAGLVGHFWKICRYGLCGPSSQVIPGQNRFQSGSKTKLLVRKLKEYERRDREDAIDFDGFFEEVDEEEDDGIRIVKEHGGVIFQKVLVTFRIAFNRFVINFFRIHAYMLTFFNMLIISYQLMSESSVNFFNCHKFGDEYLLLSSTDIVCFDEWYWGSSGLFFAVAAWIILFPPLLLIFLICTRPVHMERWFRMRFGTLYYSYHPSVAYWYEPYSLFKRCALVFLMTFSVPMGLEIGNYLIALVLLLALMVHIRFQPYRLKSENYLETLSLATLLLLQLIKTSQMFSAYEVFASTLMICLFLPTFTILTYFKLRRLLPLEWIEKRLTSCCVHCCPCFTICIYWLNQHCGMRYRNDALMEEIEKSKEDIHMLKMTKDGVMNTYQRFKKSRDDDVRFIDQKNEVDSLVDYFSGSKFLRNPKIQKLEKLANEEKQEYLDRIFFGTTKQEHLHAGRIKKKKERKSKKKKREEGKKLLMDGDDDIIKRKSKKKGKKKRKKKRSVMERMKDNLGKIQSKMKKSGSTEKLLKKGKLVDDSQSDMELKDYKEEKNPKKQPSPKKKKEKKEKKKEEKKKKPKKKDEEKIIPVEKVVAVEEEEEKQPKPIKKVLFEKPEEEDDDEGMDSDDIWGDDDDDSEEEEEEVNDIKTVVESFEGGEEEGDTSEDNEELNDNIEFNTE